MKFHLNTYDRDLEVKDEDERIVMYMTPSGEVSTARKVPIKECIETLQRLDEEAKRREYGPYARKLPEPPEGWRWHRNTIGLQVLMKDGTHCGCLWIPFDGRGIVRNTGDLSDIPIDAARCLLEEYDSRPK